MAKAGPRKVERSLLDLVQPHLRSAPAYAPVTPPERLAERLGVPAESILKLDANENPYGPSPKALAALGAYAGYHIYPDPLQLPLREALGRWVGYERDWVVAGAGSDELIELAIRMFVGPGQQVLNFPPTFGMYTFLADTLGARWTNVTRRPDYSLDLDATLDAARDARLIFAVSPNNPTGTPLTRDELEALLGTGLPVVVDEAYAEFAGESYVDLVRERPNLLIIRTLSKWAGLAGLRVGYMVCEPDVVDLVLRIKQPYSVSVAAETAALASFEDLTLLRERIARIVAERERLTRLLAELPGFEVTPSHANFVLCRLTQVPAREVYARLMERGIMVRYFDTPLLQNHIRITVGRPEQTDALIEGLRRVIGELGGGRSA
jgi:histidinol-phosphate aminotransferase